MITSINFIDGLDGLSSGIGSSPRSRSASSASRRRCRRPASRSSRPLLHPPGALLGFLRWNFHLATIFTGTSGVMFLGYTWRTVDPRDREGRRGDAGARTRSSTRSGSSSGTVVAARRSPDRGHLHHRSDVGLSHRQTVLLIYGSASGWGCRLLLSGRPSCTFIGVFFASGSPCSSARGGLETDEPFDYGDRRPWCRTPNPSLRSGAVRWGDSGVADRARC